VVRVGGYHYVDLDGLVRIMNASTKIQNHQILLQLPRSPEPHAGDERTTSGFSHHFMAGAIETIAAMREWSTTLVVAIRNSLPIGDSMAPYRGRAVDQLRLAQSSATTEADREAFNLLNVEFQKVDTWNNKLVAARNSMNSANLTMSENAIERDPEIQSLVRCGQFLGSMLASGALHDDGSCD
jgi:hypothetical protein